jgi:type IV pilus assembly protein PilB
LIERGTLTPSQLEAALARKRETGARVGETLIEMGYLTEGELFAILASQLGLPKVHRTADPLRGQAAGDRSRGSARL